MKINDQEFTNNDITVTYDPCKCILSGTCAKELSEVFSDKIIPWINLDNTKTDKIIKQIKRCPSGALKFYLRKENVA